MGAANTYQQHPALGQKEVFDRYQAAIKTLCCRALGEPYNFHLIDDMLTAEMCGRDYFGGVLAEAQKQYRDVRRYSAQSIAAATGHSAADLLKWSQYDSNIDLLAAWELFEPVYGQWVEIQAADLVRAWIGDGRTSEEIRQSQERFRKEKGLSARVKDDDGKPDFERELIAAIDCRSVSYPVRPPVDSLRQAVPFFEPGDYIVVAGRTGMGKSYFGLNCNYQSALDNVPSCYINLENSPKNVQRRLWQMHSGIKWQREYPGIGQVQIGKMMEAWEWVKRCPVRSYTPPRNLQAVLNTIRRDYYENGCQLAVVDYVQKIRESSFRGSRVDELAEISAEFRQLSTDLKIPVIALAQINREGERGSDRRPAISDIRGSGDIEQDATMILLLYRPSYYEIEADESGNLYPENYADILIGKGRDTEKAKIKCRFDEVRGFYDASILIPGPSKFSDNPPPVVSAHPPASARPNLDNDDIPF